MMPPEMTPGIATPDSATVPPRSDDPASGVLRTDLLHRHLEARVSAARDTLELLEARDPSADERLVARFGALVTEAQRTLDLERAEAAQRGAQRLADAQSEAGRLLAEAERDARAMGAVVASLRQTTVAEPGDEAATADGAVLIDVRDDVVLDLADPHHATSEAPAS